MAIPTIDEQRGLVGRSDKTVTFSALKKRRTPDFIPDLYVMYVCVLLDTGSPDRLLHISCVCVCGWRDAVCRNLRDSTGLDWTQSFFFFSIFYYRVCTCRRDW